MKYTPNHPFPPSFYQITKSIDELLLKDENQKYFSYQTKNNLNLMKKRYPKKLVYLNSFSYKKIISFFLIIQEQSIDII